MANATRNGPMMLHSNGSPCILMVCRGCCCGTYRKHPAVDHDGHVAVLRKAAAESPGTLAVRTTDCLGPCERSNVIVVQPSTRGRLAGGRALWLGWALDDDLLDLVISYARAGGPGLAELPAALDLHRTEPPRLAAATRGRRY
jgi:hypothetical protein